VLTHQTLSPYYCIPALVGFVSIAVIEEQGDSVLCVTIVIGRGLVRLRTRPGE
jgi:hypothetical protein